MPTWSRNAPGDDGCADAGAECEAFLAGRWVEHLEARGQVVPSWAWLNRLAHAEPAELRRIADAGPSCRPWAEAWNQASSFLARELLDLSQGAPARIAELQRTSLIPFELSLFADAAAGRLNAGQLLVRALATLPDRSSQTA